MLCHACDSPLPPSMGRKPRKWCSDSCRVWALRYPGEKRGGRACGGCGADISDRSRGAAWCSDTCRFRSSPKPPRPCDGCGVDVKSCGRVALCSACALDRKRERWRKGNRRIVARPCVVCATTFEAPKRARKTCSDACAQVLHDAATERAKVERRITWPKCSVWFKSCAYCGDLFTSKTRARRCCSSGCRNREYDQRARPASLKRCKCGAEIKPARNKCDACRAAAHKAKKQRERRRRRALKLASVTEPYTLAEIALRDGFRCGLCGCKVRMNLAVPHPKAPTIDHVIPISISRDDTKANVQLAHFICNSIKGDRGGDEQLALIG